MNALKSFWVQGFIGMLTAVSMNVFLIMGESRSMLDSIEINIPEPEVIENSKYWTFRTREIEKLIEDLTSRQTVLIERSSELDKREAFIETEQKELERTRADIDALQAEIRSTVLKVEKGESANLADLAKTYSNMPPEAAIEIFKEMDDLFVVKILSLMDSDTLAPIFQAMLSSSGNAQYSAKRVARLTELMRKRQE